MFRCKGIDPNIYEISVFYGFRLLNYFTSFCNDDFSSFKNYTKDWEDCGKEIHNKFKTKTSQLIVRIFKLSHAALRTNARSYEMQARSPSDLFTSKSKQNITTIKPFSLEPTREDGVTSSCSFMMHCTLVEWNAFWSKVINSRICTPFYILFLNSDYVVAHSTRTLCSNKHFTESITRKFKPRFFVQQCQKHVTKVDPSIHKNGYSML